MPLHPQDHPALVRLVNAHRRAVPVPPPGTGTPRPPRRLEVFGTGTDWIQLTWSRLGPGPVTLTCGDHVAEIRADGGPGSHLVTGLPSGCAHRIELTGPGTAGPAPVMEASTLAVPGGRELLRVATVSDVHVGSLATGYLHTIAEIPAPATPHPVRCLRSAIDEALGWGAQHLIVKGDLVDRSDDDKWHAAGTALRRLPVPLELVPGNHERSKIGDVDPDEGARAAGLRLVEDLAVIDRDGVRIVLADTTLAGTDRGHLGHVGERIVEAARATSGPVLVPLHHQLMRWPVPTYIPLGIPGRASRAFLHALGSANARVLVTSGHTHRHRRYDVGPVTVTEVGSTKDFPGTWAGYQVYEGGIVQTVRRTGEPSVIRWTDRTRRAALGLWALWAPGPLRSRCFTRAW